MKKIIVLVLILCEFSSVYSQDLIKEIQNLTLANDSLQKQVINPLRDSISHLNTSHKAEVSSLQEQITILENDKVDLNKNNNALANIVNSYKNKTFDNLIKSSTKLSIQRDMQFVGDIAEVKPILSDLQKYFNAEELLAKKFDATQIKNTQAQVNQIKQESALLDKLKESIDKYQIFNDGVKKTVGKIVKLDGIESVAEMSNDIQKQKFNKILDEISAYIFNYDFNFIDYPYLSDIVLEIIKRKQPNADADVSDLLRKLQ